MKQKTVWLLSGIPGSGKSTWARNKALQNGGVWCSRDEVRFSMLNENDSYFSQEDRVFQSWIANINNALNMEDVKDVYVDATHLTDKSRNKTRRRLNHKNIDKIVNVIFDVPLEVCLERNAQRTGRAAVPEDVIKNMYNSFTFPNEVYTIYVDQRGMIVRSE